MLVGEIWIYIDMIEFNEPQSRSNNTSFMNNNPSYGTGSYVGAPVSYGGPVVYGVSNAGNGRLYGNNATHTTNCKRNCKRNTNATTTANCNTNATTNYNTTAI